MINFLLSNLVFLLTKSLFILNVFVLIVSFKLVEVIIFLLLKGLCFYMSKEK